MMPKILGSFYTRLILAMVACFAIAAMILLYLAQQASNQYQQEVEQRLHWQLADHLVHDTKLFSNGLLNAEAIKHTFHTMMILGPSFEFYVLDPQGRVINYAAEEKKIKRRQVNLQPIQRFLAGETQMPLKGDDPRHELRQKIFSAAEVREGGELRGYLYVIIGGELYDNLSLVMQQSHVSRLFVWGVVLVMLFTLSVILLVFGLLTRPLRRLSGDIEQFQQQGFDCGLQQLSQWRQDSRDEIQTLGRAFNDLAESLNGQYQKVRDTDTLRRELVSYVSHDLRTPLAALQGYLETWMLKRQQLTPAESEKLIRIALDNAAKTSDLVEQLFELARLDSAEVHLHKEPVAIAELVQDVLEKLRLKALKYQVSLKVEPEDPGLMAYADIQRIERVFTNLIDNAVRHCQPGDSVQVLMQPDPENQKLRVHVKDTGSGIPSDELQSIFKPHFRASNTVTDGQTHSGLGLAITQRILELHESKIAVDSTQGKGTTFSFQLAMAS